MTIHPTVNINGTSRQALRSQAMAVREASHLLIQRLLDAMPHGRDYPIPAEYAKARDDHYARLAAVSDIYNHFEQIAIKVAD
jgi:hypothetical protein